MFEGSIDALVLPSFSWRIYWINAEYFGGFAFPMLPMIDRYPGA